MCRKGAACHLTMLLTISLLAEHDSAPAVETVASPSKVEAIAWVRAAITAGARRMHARHAHGRRRQDGSSLSLVKLIENGTCQPESA